MKLIFSTILYLTTFLGNCQDSVSNYKVLYTLEDLKLLNGKKYSIHGDFSYGDGFVGYIYSFQNDGSFEQRTFSCMDNSTLSTGNYSWSEKGEILMSSENNSKERFFLYQFDKFYFLIPVSKDQAFRKDFSLKAKEIFKYSNSKKKDDYYTDQLFISFGLAKTYYTKLE